MKKRKIIQVVEFKGEIELLKYRLENFHEVDEFIIIGSIPNDIKNVCNLESNDDGRYKKLTEYLLKNCKNFEDIIIISNDYEFCDFSRFENVYEEINFGAFFVKHLNFWWGRNYVSNKLEKNSLIFNFSHLIRDEKLIQRRMNNKVSGYSHFKNDIFNGWCFNGFFNHYENNFYKENLLPHGSLLVKLKQIDETIHLPPNLEQLPEYRLNTPKKILIVLENDECFDDKNYSKIIRIKFTEKNYDVLYETSDYRNFLFEMRVPSKVLYGDKNYDDFISEFKEMEIKKVIDLVKVTDEDIIEIKNPS